MLSISANTARSHRTRIASDTLRMLSVAFVSAGALFVSGDVTAGEPPAALVSAESQALFDDGMALLQAGNFSAACPKLAASLKLEPGIGTKYHLGDCYEHIGKLASAYALFRDIEETAKRQDQKDEAQARRMALEPRLIRLIIEAGNEVLAMPGLVVKRGEEVLLKGQFGTAVPIDPGAIEISATAIGKKRWSTTLQARKEGTTLAVQIAKLENAPVETSAPSPPIPMTPSWSTQRILGLTTIGFGVMTMGIGGAFGLVAIDKKNTSERDGHCTKDGNPTCDDIGLTLRRDGRIAGDVATALIIAGVASTLGGVILTLTASNAHGNRSSGGSIAVFAGEGGLGVQGRW